MCRFCDMMNYPQGNETDIKYAESTNWICVGNKITGNPYVVYKKHYTDDLDSEKQEEAKLMINLLVTKYWHKLKVNVRGETYPHTHIILSEVQ